MEQRIFPLLHFLSIVEVLIENRIYVKELFKIRSRICSGIMDRKARRCQSISTLESCDDDPMLRSELISCTEKYYFPLLQDIINMLIWGRIVCYSDIV